jgi:hypothetical protein
LISSSTSASPIPLPSCERPRAPSIRLKRWNTYGRLTSQQPIWIGWGGELTFLYNDPYKSIIGGKHPWALGRPTSEVWSEIWDDISPLLAKAMGGEEGTYVEAQLLIMERNGFPEETYYTFSYSPIPHPDGSPGGILRQY